MERLTFSDSFIWYAAHPGVDELHIEMKASGMELFSPHHYARIKGKPLSEMEGLEMVLGPFGQSIGYLREQCTVVVEPSEELIELLRLTDRKYENNDLALTEAQSDRIDTLCVELWDKATSVNN